MKATPSALSTSSAYAISFSVASTCGIGSNANIRRRPRESSAKVRAYSFDARATLDASAALRKPTAGSVGEVIKTALIEQSATLRVPLDRVERARKVLAGFPNLTVDQVAEQADVLSLSMDGAGTDAGSTDLINVALAAIAASGIPVLSFELEGARLSDAFFKMTSEAVV